MGAPQVRLSELGERLIDLGWEVEALTALPNYPTGRVFDGYEPRRVVVEQVGRIRTVRVPLWPSRRGFAARMVTYTTFATSAAHHGPRRCVRPDVLYVESPPLFLVPGAWWLGARWRCPYVLNVSDLWPESAIRMGVVQPGPATWAAGRLELAAYRRAAAVTGQTDEIVAAVRARVPDRPARVITNGCDPSRFGRHLSDDAARTLLGSEPGPVFVYAGLLGHAQGLDQILDVARALPDRVPGRFVIVGDGPLREELSARIEREGLRRVRLVGPQPRDRIPAVLGSADAAIITLGMALPGAVPSKIYEAMASELPIVLVASGEAARRVEEVDAGIAVDPGDGVSLSRAVERLSLDAPLRARLGRAGRRAAETRYDRTRIAADLSEFLHEVCGLE